MGRPSDYTPQLAIAICAELADGISLRAIARRDDMPAMSTIFKWLSIHADFAEQYARAKEESADAMTEDILDISDAPPMMTTNKNGDPIVDSGAETMRKTRIDARKWIAAKLKPKKYGDKLDAKIEHSGGMTVTIQPSDVSL